MPFTVLTLATAILFVSVCPHGAAPCGAAPTKAAAAQSRAAGTLAHVTERAAIVPRVDHHQHIVGPKATIPWPTLAPAANMPPELNRILRERDRSIDTGMMGSEDCPRVRR